MSGPARRANPGFVDVENAHHPSAVPQIELNGGEKYLLAPMVIVASSMLGASMAAARPDRDAGMGEEIGPIANTSSINWQGRFVATS